jgi:DNA-binding CsgD family transcriptional regulator
MKNRLEIIGFILLSLMTTQCTGSIPGNQELCAHKGIFDLRGINIEKEGPFQLKGEWEFYWKTFLSHHIKNSCPGSIYSKTVREQKESNYITLPGSWAQYIYNGENLPKEGYGTFRLHVLLDKNPGDLAFQFYEQTNPLKVFVNNSPVASIGTIGINKEQEQYDSYPHIAQFSCREKELDIIVQVSNFQYRQLAGQKPIIMGTAGQLLKHRTEKLIREGVVAGAILIFGFYHLISFFTIKKKITYNLLFSFLCFLWVLRFLFVKDCYILLFFPHLPWELRKKIGTAIIFGFMFSYIFYMKSLFPRDTLVKTCIVKSFIGSIVFIIYWILPPPVFRRYAFYFIFYLHFSVIVFIAITAHTLVSIIKHKRKYSLLFTVNTGILLITILLEIVSFYINSQLVYPSFYIFLLYILLQTIININYIQSHLQMVENLQAELQEKEIEALELKDSHRELCQTRIQALKQSNHITPREKDIIMKIIENKKNMEIANELFISYFTVRSHIENIYRKFGINNRVSLIKYLIRHSDNEVKGFPRKNLKRD